MWPAERTAELPWADWVPDWENLVRYPISRDSGEEVLPKWS